MNDRKIGLEDLEEINKQNELRKKENKKKKKKKERKSIFERFSTKENIIIFSFLLIFLIIGWNLINKYDPYNEIDYRKLSLNTLLNSSDIEHDREIYWILNDIILNYLYSDTLNTENANGEGEESMLHYKYSTSEYYNALEEDYQKYLKKDAYIELSKLVISKYKDNYENLNTTSNEVPIRKIYNVNSLGDNYYLVRLNTSKETYIGIHLFKEDLKFKIFYLE